MGTGIRRVLVAGIVTPLAAIAALPILLLGLPFWIVGGATRGVSALFRRMEPRAVPWQELIEYEPELGWKTRPDLEVAARHDIIFRLTTDAEGWRDREISLEDADIVALGDSFAFGTGVDDRHFFGRQASVRVKAVAAPAYSMVHGLLWLERLGERLRGKLVVWFVYYGNDLYENLRPNHGAYRMPFVRRQSDADGAGEWEVVTSHVRRDPWPVDVHRRYLQRLAELCTSGPLAERAFAAARHLIACASEVSGSLGARLVVLGIPDPSQLTPKGVKDLARRLPKPAPLDPERPDRALATICDELGVPFVALARHVTRAHYKADDCHWTPEGHALVARLLEELYRARTTSSMHGSRPVRPFRISRAARLQRPRDEPTHLPSGER